MNDTITFPILLAIENSDSVSLSFFAWIIRFLNDSTEKVTYRQLDTCYCLTITTIRNYVLI